MKNFIHVSIVCLTCFLLVAATKPERYVKDNVFYSSSPKLEVKVDPKFKYLGRLDYTTEQLSPDRVQVVTYETKSYVFADAVDNKLKKTVYIQIRREQTKYVGNLLGDVKANLKSGLCSLGEEEYTCFTRLIFLSADEPISKFILDNGYTLPECVLTRAYARVDTANGNYLIIISYNEDLSAFGFDCQAWLDKDRPTEQDENYIFQFEQNSGASFNIVSKDTLKDRKSRLYQNEESTGESFIAPRDQP